MTTWHTSSVLKGPKVGRELGFPTTNLDPKVLDLAKTKLGVYACLVRHKNNQYQGVLFFGPKKTFDKIENTLEIHILNFDKNIYGEKIDFKLGKYIRAPMKFSSIEKLKKQIEDDIKTSLSSVKTKFRPC